MDSATWSRLRPILEAALERASTEREAFVRSACAGDERLAERALELLRGEDGGSGLLEDTSPLGSRAAAAAGVPAPGARLGPWRLERLLGQGGMGAVWLANRADAAFTQRVAIKLMRPDLGGEDVLRRFRREQALLAALEHPGIARLIDVGRDGRERPYLVMEFVEGQPIDAWCRRARPGTARARGALRGGLRRAGARPRPAGRAPRPQARQRAGHARAARPSCWTSASRKLLEAPGRARPT